MPIQNATFKPTTRGVILEGVATPNATVTAENLSAQPFGPSTDRDTFASVKADAQGHFKVAIPLAMEGDKVGVSVGGGTQNLLDVRLGQAGVVDTRRAEIGQQGLRLVESAPGSYGFENVRKSKRLGEPGAQFVLTNARTHEKFAFKLDGKGQLPKDAHVKGQPGDAFMLNVSDGTNLKYMTDRWSHFVVPQKPDAQGITHPVLTDDATKPGVKMEKLTGPLFVDGAQPKDAMQGALGDCYMVSTAASIAAMNPKLLEKMIKDNGDGTVTVTFKQYDDVKKRYVDKPITVTREVPTHWGNEVYAAKSDTKESWFPMMEKAYAAWKGGYSAAECGYPYEMFEAFLGVEGNHIDTRGLSEAKLWSALKKAVDHKAPTVVWTGQEDAVRKFTNSGLYGDHAYSLLGVSEENGKRFVTLRNPWGQAEPTGNGPNDGVFKLPLADFQKFYVGVGIAE